MICLMIVQINLNVLSLGSTEQGQSSRKKRGPPRRVWTSKEDQNLIIALKQLVADGEKSDNGFKPNYLAKLEAAMKKKDPYTDLKGNPHINSKITAWKRNYHSLTGVLSKSGVGFNLLGNFKIDCLDDDLWASYERVIEIYSFELISSFLTNCMLIV